MPIHALVVDYNCCSGCHSCEIACNQEYNFPIGVSGIKVYESTMKCGNRVFVNYIPVRTDLCTFCVRQLKKGKQPSCVQHCLANCLEIKAISELAQNLGTKKSKQMIFI